jgi:hypothetical protein
VLAHAIFGNNVEIKETIEKGNRKGVHAREHGKEMRGIWKVMKKRLDRGPVARGKLKSGQT